MKAAQITGFRKVEITDIPDLGELKDGEVRFKTDCISVCGEDIHSSFEKIRKNKYDNNHYSIVSCFTHYIYNIR